MQPGAWVELEELPRLASGKVDRRGLPEARGSGLEGEYQGPRGELEEVLSGIYGEVLGLERVSVEDSFFELGGHSLLAMQVVSRVRERLGVELGLWELFEGSSVRQLGRAVEEAMREAAGVGLPELERVQRAGEQPLSYGQQRLWFLEQMEPGSPEYNVPLRLRLEGELGVEELRWALGEVVRRHEVLRTVFVSEGGRARQEVGEWQGMELEEEDLREEGEEGARRMAEAEGLRGFDLERGPLLRARLLRLGERQWVLLLTLHHIVTDGWSVGVMWREGGELYGARRRGEEARLGELGLQYVDYAVWQRRWLEGEEMERQVRSWRERLEGWPQVLELGLGGERPGVKGWRGGVVGLGLGEGGGGLGGGGGAERGVGGAGEEGRGDAVHDAAGGVGGAAVEVQRAEADAAGDAGGGEEPEGAGGAGGVLREHAGGEGGGERGGELRGAAGAGARGGGVGAGAPGGAVREAGGGAWCGARPGADAAVPGDVHLR